MENKEKLKKDLEQITQYIKTLSEQKQNLSVAIDGYCASGKTTVAALLRELLPCRIVPMDDFFLPPELRTEERLNMPGGNFHLEKFAKYVLPALESEEPQIIKYRPFNCDTMKFSEEKTLPPEIITIVEGSYSLHPKISSAYDIRIFINIDPETQLARLQRRESKKSFKIFMERWIPMENGYFEKFQPWKNCDIILTIPLSKSTSENPPPRGNSPSW